MSYTPTDKRRQLDLFAGGPRPSEPGRLVVFWPLAAVKRFAATYSTFGGDGRMARPTEDRGALYICTGVAYPPSPEPLYCYGSSVYPIRQWVGPIYTWETKNRLGPGSVEDRLYTGLKAVYGGREFVIGGPHIEVRVSGAP